MTKQTDEQQVTAKAVTSTKHNSSCLQKAWDDEPIFVLLGRDTMAPKIILNWVAENSWNQPKEKLHEALDVAFKMQDFYIANCPAFEERKKLAPTPAVTELAGCMQVLCRALVEDSQYREGWKANIAVAFQDAWAVKERSFGSNAMERAYETAARLHEISNTAADNFLQLLTINTPHTITTPAAPTPDDRVVFGDQDFHTFDSWCFSRYTYVEGRWTSLNDKKVKHTTKTIMEIFRKEMLGE